MSGISSFLSEAYSVYTEVTSILASDATHTASATSSSTPASSSATSTSSSSSSSTTSASSTASQVASSTLASAATTSSAAVASAGNSNKNRNLAIILGCVLGALALGLLILALLLCCRRRRRSRTPERILSPEDDEVDSWRSPDRTVVTGSRAGLLGRHDPINHHNSAVAAAAAPPMTEHPAYQTNNHQHQNPFVPVPPPARRTAPNSRAGLTDGAVPGAPPYISDARFLELHDSQHHDHHTGEALAAGAGGAALGAAAMHHHNKSEHKYDYVPPYEGEIRPDHDRSVIRKPMPTGYGPVPTTTTNDDAYALNKIPSRKSDDYVHPYNDNQNGTRQANTGAPLSPFNSAGHVRNPSHDRKAEEMVAGAGLISAGALAMDHHHNRNNSPRRNDSPRRSYDTRREEPHPNALLNSQFEPQRPVDDLTRVSNNSASTNDTYNSANQFAHNRNTPSEMLGDIPSPPSTRPRRDSQIGAAAPLAAAAAYTSDSERRRRSSQSPYRGQYRRDETPPAVPSRSPRRARFSEPPVPTGELSPVSPLEPPSRGIVGDNGYPPINTRRGSVGPSTVDNSRYPAHLHESSGSGTTSSDDSTWRLSSGMPGSWRRESTYSNNRRDSSPATTTPSELQHLRNSNPAPRTASPRNSFGASDPVNRKSTSPGGRRLRLADLRREEEERERGRISGGYGGHGVGQAL